MTHQLPMDDRQLEALLEQAKASGTSAEQLDLHVRNFLDCVKSRKPTITPVQTAHHSTLPGHLGLISMLVGRKIYWDPVEEIILNDSFAGNMLSRPYRRPYKLD